MMDEKRLKEVRVGLKLDSFYGAILSEKELKSLPISELLKLKKSISDYLKLIESVSPNT